MRKIMVVGAHPADCVDLAGGTIYRHTADGDEVHLVTVTDGYYSHTLGDFTMGQKRAEFREAALAVGVQVERLHFFGLIDEPLVAAINALAVRDMAVLIRGVRPDTLITHHPNEYAHWDHHECGEFMCRALKAAVKLPAHFGGEPHHVPNVLFFAVQFRPEVARVGVTPQPPDVLIELPPEIVQRKANALYCFASQGHNDYEKLRARMWSFEGEMGRADGLRFSEGFIFGQPLKLDRLPGGKDVGFYTAEKKEG